MNRYIVDSDKVNRIVTIVKLTLIILMVLFFGISLSQKEDIHVNNCEEKQRIELEKCQNKMIENPNNDKEQCEIELKC